MELLDIMRHRRSVRVYTDAPIPEADLSKILEAGLLSPSGHGYQAYEMYVTTDHDTIMKLSECRVGSAKMLEHAGAAIIVFGRTDRSDTWVEDCSIVMTNMHLMTDSLGYGSCWIQGRCRTAPDGRSTNDYVKEVLGLTAETNLEMEAILSIGVADESKRPAGHELDTLPRKKVHFL